MAALLLLWCQFPGPTFFYDGRQDRLQDLKNRADELLRRAEEARTMGDLAGHRRLVGEAAYLVGKISEAEGKFDDAQRHFALSRSYGYNAPEPVIPLEPAPSGYAAPPPYHDHPPQYGPPPGEVPFYGGDLWEYFRWQPYPSTRNNTLHSLIHYPPMESAMTLPEFTFAFRASYDYDTGKFSEVDEGGLNFFNGRHHSEIFQFDYGLNPMVMVGFRATAGELRASSGARSTLFDDGAQIFRRGSRSYNLESLTFRAKVHHDFLTFMETGLLAEVKFPLDSTYDVLTADSVDVGLSLLSTWHWGPLAFHSSTGVVMPMGNSDDIFRSDTSLEPVITWGTGFVYSYDRFALGLQLEGNTSALRDIRFLNESANQLVAHGSFEVNEHFYASLAAGTGFGDLGADVYVSVGLTFAY